MDFSKREIKKRKNRIKSKRIRISHKMLMGIYQLAFLAVIILVCTGIMGSVGLLQGLFDTAPDAGTVNVVPSGYATRIYDADGKRIQTLVGENANREYVTLDKIPKHVQDAFIAIEDERFWTHHGIDVQGVFRAAVTGFRDNDFSQGASTITQQLLKNQVFEGGNEVELADKVKRKIQEQYLAVELEHQMPKEEILEYYLNTINLGQNTLGVQAASKRYFGKKADKLTISEAAVIAGITQNPSGYNPIVYPERNRKKRSVILSYMKQQGLITPQEYNEAVQDKVYKRIRIVNEKKQVGTGDSRYNSYFTDALIEQVLLDLKDDLGYTETQAYDTLYRGGLKIYTTQDSAKQQIVDKTVNDDKLYPPGTAMQLSYRLSVLHKDGEETHHDEKTLQRYFKRQGKTISIYFHDKKNANTLVKEYKKKMIKKSDRITGETVDFIVQPQVSFVLMDQATGEVKAISGGRGNKTGNRTLNRATGSLRQPGSTFKIVSAFLPALDTTGMTLATAKDDAEFYYPGTKRKVRNWYSSGYRGLTTLREGITNSMNIIAAKTLEEVTPKTSYDYLLNLGFTSLVENTTINGETFTDIALPMALGGLTKGVSNIELTTAFAAIANQGIYNKASFYTKIVDHDGNILINKQPTKRQVILPTTAWLLTDAMEDVVNTGTGTAVKFQNSSIAIAGKTGTTTKNVDLWFVGYTPYLTAGIWAGYDQNETQTNTAYHKNIWRTIMEKVSKEQEEKKTADTVIWEKSNRKSRGSADENVKIKLTEGDKKTGFQRPSGIVTETICTKCGKLAVDGLCDQAPGGPYVRREFFAKGTAPTESCDCHIRCRICLSSGRLATENCPPELITTRIYLQKEETGRTDDTPYIMPGGLANSICPVHGGSSKSRDKMGG